MNARNAAAKSIRPALAIAGLLLSAAILVPLFSSPAGAVVGTPPTCYPNPRNCIACAEKEMTKIGTSRCVKCYRVPGCRIRMPWNR
jgi:hypothetical protein